MRFLRHINYGSLPRMGSFEESISREDRLKEFDEAFDRVAAALGEVYLVDDGDGGGVKGSPISMSRYFDPCRQHTIVVYPKAWHPDVVRILCEQLQALPSGWTFAIDASEFPPGQAHIVVEADGTVHGWCEFRARSTLAAFGFPAITNPVKSIWFRIYSAVDNGFRSWKLRRFRKRVAGSRIEDLIQTHKDPE